ncbi:MAG: hypothetical protein HOO99_07120 [Hyphomicrobiaceae bacterium]|nr:hypothetical protein [Hyphomicrobiaceae bacterium]
MIFPSETAYIGACLKPRKPNDPSILAFGRSAIDEMRAGCKAHGYKFVPHMTSIGMAILLRLDCELSELRSRREKPKGDIRALKDIFGTLN